MLSVGRSQSRSHVARCDSSVAQGAWLDPSAEAKRISVHRGNEGKAQGRQTPKWRLPEKAAGQSAWPLGWVGRVRFAVARLPGFTPSPLALVSVPSRFATLEPRRVEPPGAFAAALGEALVSRPGWPAD